MLGSIIPSYNKIYYHSLMEWRQFKKHYKPILLCIFLMIYVASSLGRNLAYYRNVQGPRLQDLGFDILPELPQHWKVISEVTIYLNHIIGIGVILSPLLLQKNFSTILIGKRILTILAIGHMVRISFYLSTSLPSPASHCLPDSTSYNPPTTIWQIFFRVSTYKDLNCGDLIFSGHIFQNFSFTILTWLYAKHLFESKIFVFCISYLQTFMSLVQIIFVIAARNHYTVDVTVGIYVSITLWLIITKHGDVECEEQEVSIEKYLIQLESREPSPDIRRNRDEMV